MCYELANQGAKLVLSARREEELERVADACSSSSKNKLVIPLDLSQHMGYAELVAQVLKKFGKIDVLINNGGISQRSYFVDTELDVFKRIIDVNFLGTVALTKAVLPSMLERKSGMMVAVTSVTGKFATPLRTGYAASKHALHGFFDALRAECWGKGVEVLLVAPGYIKTRLSFNAVVGDGNAQGTMDIGQKNGLEVDKCASSIIKGIKKGKKEIYPGGLKEVAGVYIKRFFPGIMRKIVRTVNVT